MKKSFLAILIIIPIILSANTFVFADDAEFTYTSSGQTVTITGFNDVEGKVVVPETLDGKTVVAIADGAFGGCTHTTEIILPDTVTSIGSTCFAYSTSLKTVRLPAGISSISIGMFYQCESLIGVEIPNGVQSIMSKAFSMCTSLSSIVIPDSVTSIAPDAFDDCPVIRFHCHQVDGLAGYEFAKSHWVDCEEPITVFVNENKINFDQQPITDKKHFRTLVPLRSVLEYMGAEIVWDDMMEYADIKIDGHRILIKADSEFMRVDGNTVWLTCPAREYNGRLLLPIRDVVSVIGGKVKWDENTKIVSITYEHE